MYDFVCLIQKKAKKKNGVEKNIVIVCTFPNFFFFFVFFLCKSNHIKEQKTDTFQFILFVSWKKQVCVSVQEKNWEIDLWNFVCVLSDIRKTTQTHAHTTKKISLNAKDMSIYIFLTNQMSLFLCDKKIREKKICRRQV